MAPDCLVLGGVDLDRLADPVSAEVLHCQVLLFPLYLYAFCEKVLRGRVHFLFLIEL